MAYSAKSASLCGVGSSMAQTTKDSQNYQYVRIADLKPGVFNAIGVVKFSKVPVRSRGTDYVQVLSITDESMADNDKLVVSLFCSSPDQFPAAAVGDIIRFHRLRVEMVNGDLKARPGPGFSWLLVHEDADSPSASSKIYTYSAQSKQRVRQLQQWRSQQRWAQGRSSSTPLSDLVPSQYCDLVCQVIATATPQEGVCFLARVWDGTLCPYKVACWEKMLDATDAALEGQAGGRAVDVWIYDDHVPSCRNVRPGDFLKLSNLHAAIYKGEDLSSSGESPVLELVLHRGTAFGRGVVTLDRQSLLVATVRERLNRCLSGDWGGPKTGGSSSRQENLGRAFPADHQNQNVNAQTSLSLPVRKDPASSSHDRGGFRTAAKSGDHATKGASKPGCSHWSDSGRHHDNDLQRGHLEKGEGERCRQRGQGGVDPSMLEGRGDISEPRQPSITATTTTTTTTTPSSEETAVPSPALHASSRGEGSETNPVIVSSGSPEDRRDLAANSEQKDGETRNDTNGHGLAGTTNDNAGKHGEGGGGDGGGGGGERGNAARSSDSSYPDNELSRRLSISGSGSGGQGLCPSLQSSTETCMLQTASVVSSHHHIPRTSISEVLHHSVPGKFRVCAHLVDFHPNTLDPSQLVHLLCSHCCFLTAPPGEKTSGQGETNTDGQGETNTESVTQRRSMMKSVISATTSKLAGLLGGRFANWNPQTAKVLELETPQLCPRCKMAGRAVPLELTYLLRLVLQDSSEHCLVANLWKDSAVSFLRGVSPEVMLVDSSTAQELMLTLRRLCVGDQSCRAVGSSLPPRLDCCLFSYSTAGRGGGVNFHIFDTVLV